jgi:hypothetical protein
VIREEKAARVLQKFMRGFIARYQMRWVRRLLVEVKEAWERTLKPQEEQEELRMSLKRSSLRNRVWKLEYLLLQANSSYEIQLIQNAKDAEKEVSLLAIIIYHAYASPLNCYMQQRDLLFTPCEH